MIQKNSGSELDKRKAAITEKRVKQVTEKWLNIPSGLSIMCISIPGGYGRVNG